MQITRDLDEFHALSSSLKPECEQIPDMTNDFKNILITLLFFRNISESFGNFGECN